MNARQTILSCVFAAFTASTAHSADYTIKAGSTDVTVYANLYGGGDPSNSNIPSPVSGVAYNNSNLRVYYIRPGASLAQQATASQTVTGAHVDGGWVELSSTNAPGVYRLDLKDAVCAAGVPYVRVVVSTYDTPGNFLVTDMIDIDLVGYDQTAANLPANVTQWNGANIPGVDTAGYPKVTVKSGTGDGEIDIESGGVQLSFSGASGLMNSLGLIFGNVVNSVTNSTTVTLTDLNVDDALAGADIVFRKSSGGFATLYRSIISNSGATVTLDSPITINSGESFVMIPNSTKLNRALPNASPGAAGGLLTVGTSAGQLNPAGGRIGPDWANIGNPTSTVNLSGTTISSSQQVASVSGSIGSISGVTFPDNFGGLTITSGRVNADVTHWLGAPVLTPTVAGVPEVDITHVLGSPVCD